VAQKVAKKSRKFGIFSNFFPKGQILLSDFYKIKRQISPLSLLKCGLAAPKLPKLVIFDINLPLKRFLQN